MLAIAVPHAGMSMFCRRSWATPICTRMMTVRMKVIWTTRLCRSSSSCRDSAAATAAAAFDDSMNVPVLLLLLWRWWVLLLLLLLLLLIRICETDAYRCGLILVSFADVASQRHRCQPVWAARLLRGLTRAILLKL